MSLYTPRQLLLVLLIVAAAGAGLAIDHARRARPDLVERLERLDRVERTEPIAPRSPPTTTDAQRATHPATRAVRESRRDRTSSEVRRDPGSDDVSTDGARTHRSRAATPAEPIDINRASEPELVRLPGVGPALAARIVAARPFGDVDELRRVRGVRIALFERLRPFVVALP